MDRVVVVTMQEMNKIDIAISELEKFCHHEDCMEYSNTCPASSNHPKCKEKLGLETALAWRAKTALGVFKTCAIQITEIDCDPEGILKSCTMTERWLKSTLVRLRDNYVTVLTILSVLSYHVDKHDKVDKIINDIVSAVL
jgi:hypothetical protein